MCSCHHRKSILSLFCGWGGCTPFLIFHQLTKPLKRVCEPKKKCIFLPPNPTPSPFPILILHKCFRTWLTCPSLSGYLPQVAFASRILLLLSDFVWIVFFLFIIITWTLVRQTHEVFNSKGQHWQVLPELSSIVCNMGRALSRNSGFNHSALKMHSGMLQGICSWQICIIGTKCKSNVYIHMYEGTQFYTSGLSTVWLEC